MTVFLVVCILTFIIHMTETITYSLRFAGIKTQQIAISLSLVATTLLISRLSNMFQAPLLGLMVDQVSVNGSGFSLIDLVETFRLVIVAGAVGTLIGIVLTPWMVNFFQRLILSFKESGSILYSFCNVLTAQNYSSLKPSRFIDFFKNVSIQRIPKWFLVLNIGVSAIYMIGVLCALLASAYLPEYKATAIQLSGLVNGLATILLTIFVDPSSARMMDQAANNQCSPDDIRSMVIMLQCGKLIGIIVFAQLFLMPFTYYIMKVTGWLATWGDVL